MLVLSSPMFECPRNRISLMMGDELDVGNKTGTFCYVPLKVEEAPANVRARVVFDDGGGYLVEMIPGGVFTLAVPPKGRISVVAT
jgi:hypothetical protein